jgi:probable addiction module antidote protein
MTKKTVTTRFDVQDYLENEEACIAYIQAAFEQAEEDPAFLCVALGDVARAAGMTRVANDSGLSREGLYKSLSAEGNPSFATVQKVLRALGIQLVPKLIDAQQLEPEAA